jgi:methylated-DNA-[protein]-cysteine S-methyltransferase
MGGKHIIEARVYDTRSSGRVWARSIWNRYIRGIVRGTAYGGGMTDQTTDETREPTAARPPDPPPGVPPARFLGARVLDAPIGPLLLAATGEGLVAVVFHASERTAGRALERLRERIGAADGSPGARAGEWTGDAASMAHIAAAEAQLEAYFAGARREFDVPLDWSLSGGFNARVLHELAAHVPYGTVVGYQDLARRVGEPGAAQAVGRAMGSNPLPVVVPCHRVVESGGGLGGFGGGLETKRRLLELEGVLPAPLF